jgi:uncharacterized protein DUF6527
MGQVSSTLRRFTGGYAHWCPGCNEVHTLPDSWKFDGNLESPTFHPSFLHTMIRREFKDGNWTGEWLRDSEGKTIPAVCHYTLTSGQLHFHADSTHALAGQVIPLPKLPDGLRDL